MLLLDATDGQSDFKVMEYQYISHLDIQVKPGTKVPICSTYL